MRQQIAFLSAFNTWLRTSDDCISLRNRLTVENTLNIYLTIKPTEKTIKPPYMVYTLIPQRPNQFGLDQLNISRITLQVAFYCQDVRSGGNLRQISDISYDFQKAFDSKILTLPDNIEMTSPCLENSWVIAPEFEHTGIIERYFFDTFFKGGQ